MATTRSFPSWKAVIIIALFSLVLSCNGDSPNRTDQEVYIVYMGDRPRDNSSATAQHKNLLQETLGSKRAAESWLYSYTRSLNGFVAKLTKDESTKIANSEGVVSVFPSKKKELQTTRSWDFIGFPVNVERTQTESDIIIGVLDSGIWPESQSFDDKGFGPPPSKWKGSCQSSSNFTCNNKIVGAKYYHINGTISPPNIPSPRDSEGHGTHTASIAAGGLVSGANLYGLATGTARGGVPSARIAVYKICWPGGCSDEDILAAFDDAIADGVDIISISAAESARESYYRDSIAIGAFHAMKNGVLTSNAVGNFGSFRGSLGNISPWSLSVAASTIDRKFMSKVVLGNNKTYEGDAVNTFTLTENNYPLVYGGNVPNTTGDFHTSSSAACDPNSLDPKLVNGAIVFCKGSTNADTAAAAGAIGAVFDYYNCRSGSSTYPLPTSCIGAYDDGVDIYNYINQTRNPTATILKSNEVNDTSAPSVLGFSSRGPNPLTGEILKPDLTAPGMNILASWSEATTVTGSPEDTRVVSYNIISGTSVSCPHAAAAAAYVKSFNPTWSPAAISSALMTTATSVKSPLGDDEFAYGSGQINPLKAKSPGLVYDMGEADYVKFLCAENYDNKFVKLMTGDNATNCTAAKNSSVNDLNYPSFCLGAGSSVVFHRTVTNVGSPSSTYRAVVTAPKEMSIQVEPSTLSFTSLGEKQTFAVHVNSTLIPTLWEVAMASGSLVWDDGVYQVKSPIVTYAYPSYD